MAALNASDIPREAILVLDAPACEGWIRAFLESGWDIVSLTLTGNEDPPSGRVERRERHLAMRRLSQTLTQWCERVLYLEDDTLVPPDVWSRLSALLDEGYMAASGVQRGRHGCPVCGVWRHDAELNIYDPFEPDGIAEADAVGHYCLMTYGDLYATIPIAPRSNEPVDCAHTRHMAPIAVDSAVTCGHLLESGEVIAV